MTIKLNHRLTAPFVTSRGAVAIWTGWKLRQETIDKAHRSVRRHPSTFIQDSKVKTLCDFAIRAVLDQRKEHAS